MGGTGLNGRNSRPRADLENPFDNDAVTGLQAPVTIQKAPSVPLTSISRVSTLLSLVTTNT